jgi:hypothetical protein
VTRLFHIGHSVLIERELYSLTLPNFGELPVGLELPTQHFAAFVACDATSVDSSVLEALARSLLKSGCVYFCSWGPNCEKVHDCFDSECYAKFPVIMTTWHDEESLDEALWFFVSDTHPDEAYYSTCGCGVAISIGNTAWSEHIRARLDDIDGLKRIVFDEAQG